MNNNWSGGVPACQVPPGGLDSHRSHSRGFGLKCRLVLTVLLCFWGIGAGGLLAQAPPPDHQNAPEDANRGQAERLATFDAAWGIINESYFDPAFHGLDWTAVKVELRPKARAATSTQELRGIIEEMLHRLGDSHMALIPREVAQSLESSADKEPSKPNTLGNSTNTLDQPGTHPGQPSTSSSVEEASEREASTTHDGDLGCEVRVKDRCVMVTRVDPEGPAGKAGVRPGWLVKSVRQQSIGELLEPLGLDMERRRAEFMAWGMITGKLTGRPGSAVRVEFLNGANEPISLELTRRRVQGEPSKLGYLPTLYANLERQSLPLPGGGGVALIRFNLWMVPIIRALDVAIEETRSADGMIIDLRGNLGGIGGMILGISGHFLNERVSLGTLKMRGNDLSFYTNPRRVSASGQRVEPYSGPLAILIDGLSLSAAEIFAGGMQALGRARVFGETSGGQALPAIWDRLPNGDVLYHAFGDFVTASGARVEGQGVSPDEVIASSRDDLLAGRDAPLLAALDWIGRQKTRSSAKAPVP
jgi:carboxyl-terminal processing protease